MVQERLPARPVQLEKEWTQDKENKLVTAYGVSLFCNKTYNTNLGVIFKINLQFIGPHLAYCSAKFLINYVYKHKSLRSPSNLRCVSSLNLKLKHNHVPFYILFTFDFHHRTM